MTTYRVDLARGEVVEMAEVEDDRLFEEFAEASGLDHWLTAKGLDTWPRTVVLSEEDRGEAARREGRPLIGAEEFLRIAAEDTGELPPGELREDAELQAELLRQSHEDAFGGPDPSDDLTDDEVWAELPEDWFGKFGKEGAS